MRFIGAGTIAVAAVWTLIILLRPMTAGMRSSLAAMRQIRAGSADLIPRTERDIPIHWVAAASLLLVVPLAAVFAWFLSGTKPPLSGAMFWGIVAYGTTFAFLFGFLIAAACGYMAGLVGSSNSPISGIGIVAITLVSLLLLAIIGGPGGLLADQAGQKLAIGVAIFVTAVIVAVAPISNDNLQDLQTGWLTGATPWRQQVALVVGCVVGALIIPPILGLLYQAYGFAGALPRPGMDASQALAAPQATLMSAIATGIFTHQLAWSMILTGIAIGVVLILVDEALRRRGGRCDCPCSQLESICRPRSAARSRSVAGIIGATGSQNALALVGAGFEPAAQWLALAIFVAVCIGFCVRVLGRTHRA